MKTHPRKHSLFKAALFLLFLHPNIQAAVLLTEDFQTPVTPPPPNAFVFNNIPGWNYTEYDANGIPVPTVVPAFSYGVANAVTFGYPSFPADAQFGLIYALRPTLDKPAGIFKEVGATLTINTNYTFSIEQGLRSDDLSHDAPLRLQLSVVSSGGVVTPIAFGIFLAPVTVGSFETRTVQLTADVITANYSALIGQTLRVDIINYSYTSLHKQLNVDNLSLTALAIPEPSTTLLLTGALTTLMIFRRRRA